MAALYILRRVSTVWKDIVDESDLIGSVPSLSPLRLVALKIRTDPSHIRLPGEVIPFTREIEISDEALEKIRAVNFTRAPMNWVRTMEHLTGLRTLALDGVYGNTITLDHILSVLVSSPSVETLSISYMEIKHPPSSLHPLIEPILLPHLRSITLDTNGALINGLMRRIRPSPEITKLYIRPTDSPSQIPASFWHETMVAALQWIQDVVGPVANVENWGLQLRVSGTAFENEGALAFIQTMRDLSAIIVGHLEWPSREAFIGLFGQPTTDSAGTPAPKSTFPTLQKLVYANWRWKLDIMMDMIKKRYSIRSLYRQQIPDLTLELYNLEPMLRHWRDRPIISFLDKKALLELDGVKEVRMGCVEKRPGMLAIVWDEEKSLPAWG
ncbi:hypothetical protein FRC00_005281 [Tulasnella sp. 408]|nr:hypothetical protein FRC00_005281 [Tulasnella sp. 408]